MASFLDLDSTYRDREQFPNPAQYTVPPEQSEVWFSQARIVNEVGSVSPVLPMDFATNIKLLMLTIPYTASSTAIYPVLYVDMHCSFYNDSRLISCINGNHAGDRFVCQFNQIINNSSNAATWIQYKCDMTQTIRFKRNDTIFFQISNNLGQVLAITDTLPPSGPNPLEQTFATFSITPYLRDYRYTSANGPIQPRNI
jgi:hypothetical protein